MKEIIRRPVYINMLANRRDNGEVKVITGSRRCGKSMLLSHLYRDWLVEHGVPERNIIHVSLDMDDDGSDKDLRDAANLKEYLYQRIVDEDENYYLFLDEIQEVEGFERLVNGLNARDNVDVYITGSNSKFLSSDINTIFRGRSDEVRVYPLSFKEFCSHRTEPLSELWKEYYTYGGMPGLLHQGTPEQKVRYLKRLWNKTYIDDVVERNGIRNRQALESVVNVLCSAVGSLTNPNRIANSLKSVQRQPVSNETVNNYLRNLEEAFLFEGASRYDIKGAKYYESLKKYYSVDVGLRNARLNFRQQDPSHIMENIIYNELRMRGFLVDVGVVESREPQNGKLAYVQYEVDFVATNGTDKYYIQSAYSIPDEVKRQQELNSFRKLHDTFQKIIVVGDDIASYRDEQGYLYIGLYDFLLHWNAG